MIKNIIDILENNRKFVLAKFKKYTVDEYKEGLRIREKNSRLMLESLKNMLSENMKYTN